MSLDYDCLTYVAEFIDHPRDWYSFATASTLTNSITNRLRTKKINELQKKWVKVCWGQRTTFVERDSIPTF